MNNSVSQLTARAIDLPQQEQKIKIDAIPGYMHEVYEWAYVNPRNAYLLDREWVVNAILWGNSPKLRRALMTEIEPGSTVFQAAHVYGRMLSDLAQRIGTEGRLDLVDVVPVQANHAQQKLSRYLNAHVSVADAARRDGRRYDAVSCYFLLHEIPDDHKHAVVDTLLERMARGGKLVFLDYHRPANWHPLAPLMYLIFRTLEPFATSLTRNEISSYASHEDDYLWCKQTFFGGLYQKVVVTRR